MNTGPITFIFDVDGVITNPVEKKVTETEIFTLLDHLLTLGNTVTLNTGRSNEWMIKRVINPFIKVLKDKTQLQRFFAVGEKGLTWVGFDNLGKTKQGVFDEKGKPVEGFDLSVFLAEATVVHFEKLEKEAKSLIEGEFSHSTFYDDTKKAMISTEMKDGYDHSKFAGQQKEFAEKLLKIIVELGLDGKFKVDPTTIATDIQIPEAGKHLGARRILDWLASKDITAEKFITVGDSVSDLEMADELYLQGKSVVFYYVNPKKPLTTGKSYEIIVTKAEFGKGTIEALSYF